MAAADAERVLMLQRLLPDGFREGAKLPLQKLRGFDKLESESRIDDVLGGEAEV